MMEDYSDKQSVYNFLNQLDEYNKLVKNYLSALEELVAEEDALLMSILSYIKFINIVNSRDLKLSHKLI